MCDLENAIKILRGMPTGVAERIAINTVLRAVIEESGAIQTASDAIFDLMRAHTHADGHHLLVERVGDQTIVIDKAVRKLRAIS